MCVFMSQLHAYIRTYVCACVCLRQRQEMRWEEGEETLREFRWSDSILMSAGWKQFCSRRWTSYKFLRVQPRVLVGVSCPSSGSEKLTPRALHLPHPPPMLSCHSRLPVRIVLTADASAFVCFRNAMFEERSVVGVNHLLAQSDSRWRHWRNWVSQYLKLFCLSRPHHAAKECNPGGSAAVIKFCVWSNDTVTLNRARWYWLRLGSEKK